jgi:hypothetical protein
MSAAIFDASTPESDLITCRTTPWYARRMILPFVMLAGMAGWFFFDWKKTYPAHKQQFQAWMAHAEKPEEWKTLSTQQGWDENPGKFFHLEGEARLAPDALAKIDSKIDEQKNWGLGASVLALIVGVQYLLGRGKVLRADLTSFTTPSGQVVPFAAVKQIDLRKWKHKGFAYVQWDDHGTLRKAEIDDLKYGGAAVVLQRLQDSCPPDTETVRFEDEEDEAESAEASESTDTPETEAEVPSPTEATPPKA